MKPQIKYALWCKPSGTYNGENGKPTKDLQKAALFTGEEAAKHSEQFRPNFEFLTIHVYDNGARMLVY